jgi:hypothetical protein
MTYERHEELSTDLITEIVGKSLAFQVATGAERTLGKFPVQADPAWKWNSTQRGSFSTGREVQSLRYKAAFAVLPQHLRAFN